MQLAVQRRSEYTLYRMKWDQVHHQLIRLQLPTHTWERRYAPSSIAMSKPIPLFETCVESASALSPPATKSDRCGDSTEGSATGGISPTAWCLAGGPHEGTGLASVGSLLSVRSRGLGLDDLKKILKRKSYQLHSLSSLNNIIWCKGDLLCFVILLGICMCLLIRA